MRSLANHGAGFGLLKWQAYQQRPTDRTGGGGLSSSVGESARFSNGAEVELEKVPLKYDGLDQWEIWVSESQERMTVAIRPQDRERFMALSRKHAVESTVIGRYTDTGKLHITYVGKTCAYVDMDLLQSGFPQWEFEAEWTSPQRRELFEQVLKCPTDMNRLLLDMLERPNICSTKWVIRQYDHEVQGTSIVKPLTGAERDVNSDAAVMRPVLGSPRGLAFAQALLPMYSAIDAYPMFACRIDEAVRRVLAVGGDFEHIGGVDNFCWPNIQFHPASNPDGKFKAAQLVRACWALRDVCLAYGIPLLSGNDSMYVDGHLADDRRPLHHLAVHQHVDLVFLKGGLRRCGVLAGGGRFAFFGRHEQVEVLDDVRQQGVQIVADLLAPLEIRADRIDAFLHGGENGLVHEPLDVGVQLLVEFFDPAAGLFDLRLHLTDLGVDVRLNVVGQFLVILRGQDLAVEDGNDGVVLLRGVDVQAALGGEAFDLLENGLLAGAETGFGGGQLFQVALRLEGLGDLLFQIVGEPADFLGERGPAAGRQRDGPRPEFIAEIVHEAPVVRHRLGLGEARGEVPDDVGFAGALGPHLTPDGRHWGCSTANTVQDLWVMEGLK